MTRAQLPSGIVTGIGGLPHRDAAAAAQFSIAACDLPAVPTLPRRSPAEGLVAQALVGLDGITVGQYGSICVDTSRFDPDADVLADLNHDAFGGWRAMLQACAGRTTPIKWQFIGPLTLGLVLIRAGLPAKVAFEVAIRSVRSQIRSLLGHVEQAMPAARQVLFLDEPSFHLLHGAAFPIQPDEAIDLISSALAAVEGRAVIGLHVCAEADFSWLVSIGADVLSVPAHDRLIDSGGNLQRFLADGGTIAWGAVPTGGPIPTSVDRPWRRLGRVWCGLVERGADPTLLRTQSMITPECGLGAHSPEVAAQVFAIAAEVGRRVHDQALATSFALGA